MIPACEVRAIPAGCLRIEPADIYQSGSTTFYGGISLCKAGVDTEGKPTTIPLHIGNGGLEARYCTGCIYYPPQQSVDM